MTLARLLDTTPHSGLAMLISRISLRISVGKVGRPPRRRDLQRQYDLNPARCHFRTVSGSGPTQTLRGSEVVEFRSSLPSIVSPIHCYGTSRAGRPLFPRKQTQIEKRRTSEKCGIAQLSFDRV